MSYSDRAKGYAEDVVAGRVVACKWVKLACRRHLDDLEKQERDDYPFRFDPEKADRVCLLLELLPHTKGRWAAGATDAERKIRLEPWQIFIECVVFGWLRKDNGKRRFRKAYIEVPRKNGKSVVAAGTGLYMFAADGEEGAEVYCGATSKEQAWEVFRPARLMALSTPRYQALFGVSVNAANLHIHGNGSRLEPLKGKPGDGASPSCYICDEFHEHADDSQVDAMETGMGAREQPLSFYITTAGDSIEGPCYALHEDVKAVLEGTIHDDTLFGIIFTIDEGDDWTTDAALMKANPNYGISVDPKFLQDRRAEALRSSRKQGAFKTKHLNLWVSARDAWLNMESWNRLADAPPLEDFEGEPCWIGLDLANKLDIVAVALLFRRSVRDEWHYFLFVRLYLPEARVSSPTARHYQGWVTDGHLITTQGTVTDFKRIRSDLEEDSERFAIQEVAYDTYGATQLATELQDDIGLTTVEFPMTVKFLSEPMKWLEALVEAGRLHHDGNPALAWCFSNVVVKPDANDNIFPRKTRVEKKIDGAVASFMGLSRAMFGEEEESDYGENGLMIFGGG